MIRRLEAELKDVGDQALMRELAAAFPILRPGLFLSYCGRRPICRTTKRLTGVPLPCPAPVANELTRSISWLAHIGYDCWVGPDAEMRAAVAAAGLGILASMLRAYAEKTGRFRCRPPNGPTSELAVIISLS
jgi:hypothetical protein